MASAIAPLTEQLKLNTRLFLTCLDGVDDASAQRRPGGESNNMVFIALHILDARCFLARYLGLEFENPYKELDDVEAIEEIQTYPGLEDVRANWREVSGRLAARFLALSDAELSAESPQEFPVDDRSVLGGIAFLLGHEAFHIGQLAFLRKYFGHGSMSY